MTLLSFFRTVAFPTAAAALFLAASASAQTSAAQVEQGRSVYMSKGCYQCHGPVGQGSVMTGPKLVPSRLQAEGFKAYVRRPAGVMPPYSAKLLPDSEVDAILAYLQALPPARPASEIPLLAPYLKSGPAKASAPRRPPAAPTTRAPAPRAPASAPASAPAPNRPAADAGRGAQTYAQHCAACHGATRAGGVGPALTDEASKRTVDQTAALIRNPPPTMPKLFPDPLSEQDVRDVAAFVRRPAR